MSRYEDLASFSDHLWECLYAWMSGDYGYAAMYDMQEKMIEFRIVLQIYDSEKGLKAKEYKTVRGAMKAMERIQNVPNRDQEKMYWFLLKTQEA